MIQILCIFFKTVIQQLYNIQHITNSCKNKYLNIWTTFFCKRESNNSSISLFVSLVHFLITRLVLGNIQFPVESQKASKDAEKENAIHIGAKHPDFVAQPGMPTKTQLEYFVFSPKFLILVGWHCKWPRNALAHNNWYVRHFYKMINCLCHEILANYFLLATCTCVFMQRRDFSRPHACPLSQSKIETKIISLHKEVRSLNYTCD